MNIALPAEKITDEALFEKAVANKSLSYLEKQVLRLYTGLSCNECYVAFYDKDSQLRILENIKKRTGIAYQSILIT